MKCPYCGEKIEPGTLFCPKCLTEIQWVPEYNTVETLMKQKKHEERKKKRADKRTARRQKKIRSDRRRKWAVCLCVLVPVLLTAVFAGTYYYRQNSYAYQYKNGIEAFAREDYEEALEHINTALLIEPDNPNANLALARIFEAQEDYSSVEKILGVFLKEHPDNLEAYGLLLPAMEKNGDLDEIKSLMQACRNPSVLEEFSDYICPEPETNLASGSYDSQRAKIRITGDCEKIYYTLDGTKPNKNSQVYEGPIDIKEGVTLLYAYGVNEKGIASDVIYRKYILEPEEEES